jgi:hypothetical protein
MLIFPVVLIAINLNLGCLHPVACVRSGEGGFYPSTQRHYRGLILLLNTTYTATCFGRTAIFKPITIMLTVF